MASKSADNDPDWQIERPTGSYDSIGEERDVSEDTTGEGDLTANFILSDQKEEEICNDVQSSVRHRKRGRPRGKSGRQSNRSDRLGITNVVDWRSLTTEECVKRLDLVPHGNNSI